MGGCFIILLSSDIFHGGEALTADQPQSLTCPFCGKMGFTEATLQEHVTANHLDTTFEVVSYLYNNLQINLSFTYLHIKSPSQLNCLNFFIVKINYHFFYSSLHY